MLLYSRALTLRGPQAETMAWAAEVTAYVNSKTDLEVSCWAGLYGMPFGTLSWSARVEGHAHLAAQAGSLGGDAAYAALIGRAADWIVGQGEDTMRSLVSGSMENVVPPPIGAVAGRNSAVIALGKVGEAMAWSIELAEYVSNLFGSPVRLFSDLYGTFGSVTWISVVADMAAVDRTQALSAGDAGYMQRIAAAGDLFVPGSGTAALLTRVA